MSALLIRFLLQEATLLKAAEARNDPAMQAM